MSVDSNREYQQQTKLLLQNISGIGVQKGSYFIPSDQCYSNLCSIHERLCDSYIYPVWKQLGKWGIMDTDLVPLVCNTKNLNGEIFRITLEIMLILTTPMTDLSEDKQILLNYKKLFCQDNVLNIFFLNSNPDDEKEIQRKNTRDFRQKGEMLRIFNLKYRKRIQFVELLGNILAIEDSYEINLHNQLIEKLKEYDLLNSMKLLLVEILQLNKKYSKNTRRKDDTLAPHYLQIMKVFSLLLQNEDPEELILALEQNQMDEISNYNKVVLNTVLLKERIQKQKLLRSIPRRHSKFGGVFVKKTSDGKKIISKNRMNKPTESRPIFNGRRLLIQERRTHISSIRVKKIIEEFSVELLEKNHFFHLFDHVRDRIIKEGQNAINDGVTSDFQSLFFKLIWFMLSLNRCLCKKIKSYSIVKLFCVFEEDFIKYIFDSFDFFVNPKFHIKEFLNLRFSVKLLKEVLNNVKKMVDDDEFRQKGVSILHQIIYEPKFSRSLVRLIKNFKPNENPKSYLEDLVLCVYDFTKLIENSKETFRVKKNKRKKINYDEKENLNEDEAMEVDDVEEVNSSKDFDLISFKKKFASRGVLKQYIYLLRNYISNSIKLNKSLIRMLKIISKECQKVEFLFQLSLFHVFNLILNDPYLSIENRNKKRSEINRKLIKLAKNTVNNLIEFLENVEDQGLYFNKPLFWEDCKLVKSEEEEIILEDKSKENFVPPKIRKFENIEEIGKDNDIDFEEKKLVKEISKSKKKKKKKPRFGGVQYPRIKPADDDEYVHEDSSEIDSEEEDRFFEDLKRKKREEKRRMEEEEKKIERENFEKNKNKIKKKKLKKLVNDKELDDIMDIDDDDFNIEVGTMNETRKRKRVDGNDSKKDKKKRKFIVE